MSMMLLVQTMVWSQIEEPTDKVSWKLTVLRDGDNAKVVCKVTCVEGWHINALKLPEGSFGFASVFELKESSDYKIVGSAIEPEPHFKHDELSDEDINFHEGTFSFVQNIKILTEEDFKVKGTFTFQTCDEQKCLPPHYADFTLRVKAEKKDEEGEVSEDDFAEVNGDEAKGKDGNAYIKVNNKWHQVPKGNTVAFYKKYLTILEGDK